LKYLPGRVDIILESLLVVFTRKSGYYLGVTPCSIYREEWALSWSHSLKYLPGRVGIILESLLEVFTGKSGNYLGVTP
jgi:hypothetical protein